MTKITKNKSHNYISPKAGSYTQLETTVDHKTSGLLNKPDPSYSEPDKQYKYHRFCVTDGEALCITISGLDDGNLEQGYTLKVDQISGAPTCESRKNINAQFTATDCQLVFNKPGRYEIYETDFGLLPENIIINERPISLETAKLLSMAGSAFSL